MDTSSEVTQRENMKPLNIAYKWEKWDRLQLKLRIKKNPVTI